MRVLVTGARGFIGRNLTAALREIRTGHDRRADHALPELTVLEFGREDPPETLDDLCAGCEFVFHLAGENRPEDPAGFMTGNGELTARLLESLRRQGNACPVLLASSVRAAGEDPYGRSKRAAEELLARHGAETGAEALIYRLPNVFGKWSRPNYNSAVATFCHNTARGLPITVHDPAAALTLTYIDDVVEEFLRALQGRPTRREGGLCAVPEEYRTTVGALAETVRSFPALRETLEVPRLDDPLTKKLYAAYLSFLPPEAAAHDLRMNRDGRGSFTELLRTPDRGQVSVNLSAPGVTKGNHWHHTKHETFFVVRGEALIRQRRVGRQRDGSPFPVTEYRVSGARIEAVEMLPGYTHSITNLSDTEELVTVMWASEPFDPARPDTFFEEV